MTGTRKGGLLAVLAILAVVLIYGGILFLGTAIIDSNIRDIIATDGGDFWNIFWLLFVATWFFAPSASARFSQE